MYRTAQAHVPRFHESSSCLAIAMAILLVSGGCIVRWTPMQAKATKQLSFPISPDTKIEIETQNGEVKLITDPALPEASLESTIVCSAETQEEAEARLNAAQIIVDDSASGVIRMFPAFPEPKMGGDGASFVLRLPSANAVQLTTSNGSILVDGTQAIIQGPVNAYTSNAGITIQSAAGNVFAKTTNGPARCFSIEGKAELQTTNGQIEARDIQGQVVAKSSNGSVEIELLAGQQGPIFAHTSNSGVRLHVPDDFKGILKAKTSNGRVRVEDPHERINHREGRRSSGTFVINEGTDQSEVSTSNGSIVVKVGETD